ncbi:MAG TPA: hypothetical protein VF956_00385 [Candidatus Dormibacteraeota bacterium]
MSRPNDRSNRPRAPFYAYNRLGNVYSYDRLGDVYSWRNGFWFLFLPCALVLLTIETAINVPALLIFLSFLGLSVVFTALALILPFRGR